MKQTKDVMASFNPCFNGCATATRDSFPDISFNPCLMDVPLQHMKPSLDKPYLFQSCFNGCATATTI